MARVGRSYANRPIILRGAAATAATYYVSAAGSDAADGLTPATAWQTISKVNGATILTGSSVLFRNGDTFSGQITGRSGVTFGSYNGGRATISNSTGYGVYGFDLSGCIVQDLIFTGGTAGSTAYDFCAGIGYEAYAAGAYTGIVVSNCDVSGFRWGIQLASMFAGAGFSGPTITGCDVHDCRDVGIFFSGPAFNAGAPAYQHTSVTVTGCEVYAVPGDPANVTAHTGDGILLGSVNDGLVDLCSAHGNGASCTAPEGPVGIWAYDSTAVTIRRSVSYSNRTGGTADGGGFDLDQNVSNSVIERNLAYDNDGAGILVYTAQANAAHTGNTVRDNLTWGNGRDNSYGEMRIGGLVSSLAVYHNTFVAIGTSPGIQLDSTDLTGVTARNNIVQVATGFLIDAGAALTTGDALFQGNTYWRPAGFSVEWNGVTYSSLAAWRAAVTGQEELTGNPVGAYDDPMIIDAATIPTVTDPAITTGANGLSIFGGSVATINALDLPTLFGITLGPDYFGTTRTAPYSLGAVEVSRLPGAPPALVTGGQRFRPLPPGAVILREFDSRPPPEVVTAVAVEWSIPVPLSVRLTTATADILLVEEIRDVSFRSVVPGGFASATVVLDRAPWLPVPEIVMYGRMYIYDTRTGKTVWEGRVEDPGRSADSGGYAWQVTAIGPSAHARDETFPAIWIDSTIDHYQRFGGSLNASTVSVATNSSEEEGVKVQFPTGTTVATSSYVSGRSPRVSDAGLSLASVSATATGGGAGAWTMDMYVYGPSGAELVDSNALTTSSLGYRGVAGTDFSAGQTTLHLRMSRTGAAATPDDNAYTLWTDVVVRTTLVDEEGTPVTDYSDDYVTASQIVQDVVGRHLPLFDPLDAFIEETFEPITQLAYDSTSAYDVFGDLMSLEGAYYWAAWETIPRNNKWRFEWKSWPTWVRYEAGIEDGWDSPGSAAGLYNECLVTWKNKAGRDQTTIVTASVPELTNAGLTRTGTIDLGQEVGTAAAAVLAGQAFLEQHNLPSQNGRLTIARPILDADTGQMIDPWEIRPGGLIRVRGIDAKANALNADGRDGSTVFRVVAVSFRSSDGSAELELDSDALSTSKAIARLQTQRRRR